MRSTIELPDAPCRQIESSAAMDGFPVKVLMSDLLQCGLATEAAAPNSRCTPPTIGVSQPFPANCTSNAALFDLLDEPGFAR